MITLSALLLGRRCIICPSSESRGRVAGWTLWRFMALSRALIASSSPASLGRPKQSCDQCGGPPTGGSDQNAVCWIQLGRQMAPQIDDKQRPRQKQRGDVWLMAWVRTLTWLSQREGEEEELRELWLHCWPTIVEERCNEVVRGRNFWSKSINFVMTSPKPETYFGLQRVLVPFLLNTKWVLRRRGTCVGLDYWMGSFVGINQRGSRSPVWGGFWLL